MELEPWLVDYSRTFDWLMWNFIPREAKRTSIKSYGCQIQFTIKRKVIPIGKEYISVVIIPSLSKRILYFKCNYFLAKVRNWHTFPWPEGVMVLGNNYPRRRQCVGRAAWLLPSTSNYSASINCPLPATYKRHQYTTECMIKVRLYWINRFVLCNFFAINDELLWQFFLIAAITCSNP